MATGTEMYQALRQATRTLPDGSEFAVNQIDAIDLSKLWASDLVSLGFDEKIAEKVNSALTKGDLRTLGLYMGLRLRIQPSAPPLLPQACT